MSTHRPMEGIRILDLADHTFVPAASAVLSDWGAEVIKVEHITRGDAARGLASTGMAIFAGDVSPILEHANRGKLSIALDLNQDEGRDILYKLAAISDVFLTNKMPSVREKLKTDVDDIRAANPNIIYVSGHGYGARARPRRRWLRRHLVLVPRHQRHERQGARRDDGAGHARARVRRHHRRDDDRGRHLRRAVPP